MKLTKILEEVITEIGDASAKPYDIETVIDDESHRVYNFETDEPVTWYEIDMQEKEPDDPFDNDGITLNIMFGTTDEEGNRDLKAITNKGQLYRVMATVVAAVKKDLENHRYIKTLSFEPSKRSGKDTDQSNARANLYKRFVKGQFPGADIEDGPDGKVIVRLPKKKVTLN